MTPQNVTLLVCGSILAMLLVGIIKRTRRGKIVALFPNMTVSLGVLGTFSGVLLGLYRFDVTDISNSIPVLLGGLTTAFITSIAGLIASIVLKWVYAHADSRADSEREAQDEDAIELLRRIAAGIGSLERSSKQIENTIVSCFRSDEEYSLLSQLKLIRQEISDAKRDVTRQLESFAQQLAEQSTKTIAEALKKVVEDFNALLNELVNESFRELSSAMVKLTEWQQNYRESMDAMEVNINHLMSTMKESVGILERAERNIAQIDDRLESITRSSTDLAVVGVDLATIAENLREQSSVLRESLVAIQKVGVDARTVLPHVSTHIDALTGQLEKTVQQATQRLSSQNARVLEFVEGSIGRIESADQKQAEAVSTSLRELDRHLEDQLTKSLNSLAGSMASLSAKFVQDYEPLTAKLRKVVRIAETVPARDRTYGGDR